MTVEKSGHDEGFREGLLDRVHSTLPVDLSGAGDSMRILVTGSRDWPEEDWRVISDTLWEINPFLGEDHVLIHGGARGVDTIAANVVATWRWQVLRITAEWAKHGRGAGFVRNQRMVDMNPDVCVMFRRNMSRGATDCGNRAERAGIKTYWIDYEDIDA